MGKRRDEFIRFIVESFSSKVEQIELNRNFKGLWFLKTRARDGNTRTEISDLLKVGFSAYFLAISLSRGIFSPTKLKI